MFAQTHESSLVPRQLPLLGEVAWGSGLGTRLLLVVMQLGVQLIHVLRHIADIA